MSYFLGCAVISFCVICLHLFFALHTQAAQSITTLESKLTCMKRKYESVLAYFGEEPSLASQEFFETLSTFVDNFVSRCFLGKYVCCMELCYRSLCLYVCLHFLFVCLYVILCFSTLIAHRAFLSQLQERQIAEQARRSEARRNKSEAEKQEKEGRRQERAATLHSVCQQLSLCHIMLYVVMPRKICYVWLCKFMQVMSSV